MIVDSHAEFALYLLLFVTLFVLQKKFGGEEKYGVYRDSRLAGGDSRKTPAYDPTQFHFLDNPHLANLEQVAKSQGLQYIEELMFENGAVYKGKYLNFRQINSTKSTTQDFSLTM